MKSSNRTTPRSWAKSVLTSIVLACAAAAPASGQATLDFVERIQISQNNQRADISVFPGAAGWASSAQVVPANSGTFGDGTVTDYRFINSDGNDLISYADGGAGLIPTPTSPMGGGFVSGTQNWSDAWTVTDPAGFTSTPDISPAGWSGGADVVGTVDITGLSGGTLYFMHGTFVNTWTVTVTLKDDDLILPDIVATDTEGNGPGTNFGWISSFNFCAAADYETVEYYYFNGDRDGSRARFMGVIFDADTSGPAIVSTTPPDDSTTFFSGGNLEFTVDEDILVGTGNITITDEDDGSSTVVIPIGDPQVTIIDRTITIDPTADLEFSTNYSVQLDAGIVTDCNLLPNDAIADNTTWNFTTLAPDTTDPVLVSTDPVNASTALPGATLTATFDEGVVVGTGNITLRNLTDTVDTLIDVTDGSQVTTSGNDLIITPTNPLAGGKNYAIQIDATAVDNLAGFSFAGIADDTTWFFSTYLETNMTASGNWNGGNWSDPPGQPSPGLNAIIDAGVSARADNSVDPWSGTLTLGDGAELRIDIGTPTNPADMVLLTATEFFLGDGATIVDNFKTATFEQDWNITGTAGMDSTNNSGNNHNRTFNGVIGGGAWFTDGRNLQGYTYNEANTFTSYEVRSTEAQRHGVFFGAAGSAGTGNVTVTSAGGIGGASACLILGADDVFAPSCVLTLNGRGWNGSSGGFGPYAGGAHVGTFARIRMDAFNATVDQLFIDGIQVPAGDYTGADGDWIVGTGTLTVTNGATTVPTLASIADNVGGGSVLASQTITYTVTFDSTIDASSVGTDDFENGGSAPVTVTSVTEIPSADPGGFGVPSSFAVCVTPSGEGDIILQIPAGAVITDVLGTDVDTTSALPDDTTITVDAGSLPDREVVTIDGPPVSGENTSAVLELTYDASASDKLVVFTTTENNSLTTVEYDGVPLELAVGNMQDDRDDTYGAIWYLDNPTTSTGLVKVTSNNRNAVTVMSLSNTAPGFGATAISPYQSKSVGLATTYANSLVVAAHNMGGDGNSADVNNVDAVAPLVEINAIEFGSNWGGHVAAAGEVADPCYAVYEFTGGSAGGNSTIAVEFPGAEIVLPDPLVLTIAADGANLDMSWNSMPGMQYDLLSSTDPEAEPDPSTWAVYNDGVTTYEDIPAAGAMTMLDDVLKLGPVRFFAIREEDVPPLLSENFDGGAGLPIDWSSNGPVSGTDWEVGDPTGGFATGPVDGANSGANCVGTNIATNAGQYTDSTDVTLSSPIITVPAGSGVTLSFQQFVDTDLTGDLGAVRIVDTDNANAVLGEITGIEGDGTGASWTDDSLSLDSATAGGKNVQIQIQFVSDAGDNFGGLYIDDVVLSVD